MGELRAKWQAAKKKFEVLKFPGVIDNPKKYFSKADLGPLLDKAEDAIAALRKDKTPANGKAAVDAINKALVPAAAYETEARALTSEVRKLIGKTTDKEQKKLLEAIAIVVDGMVSNALTFLIRDLGEKRKEVANAVKTVAADDPAPIARMVEKALKVAIPAIKEAAGSRSVASWNKSVVPAMGLLSTALRMSKKLHTAYFSPVNKLAVKLPDDAPSKDLLDRVKLAAGTAQQINDNYRKLLGTK